MKRYHRRKIQGKNVISEFSYSIPHHETFICKEYRNGKGCYRPNNRYNPLLHRFACGAANFNEQPFGWLPRRHHPA